MKKKTLTLISSCAAIAVCSSLIVGSTYALFTSEDKVNIAVTAGKVAISTEVTNIETGFDPEIVSSANESFSAEFNKTTKSFVLNGMAPGDIVGFDIQIANASDITVKYSTSVTCEDGFTLMNFLKVSVAKSDEAAKTFDSVKSYSSAWNTLEVSDKTVTYHVTVAMPTSGDNDIDNFYQGLSAKISVGVKAVQSNAKYCDEGEKIEKIPQSDTLTDMIASGKAVKADSETAKSAIANAVKDGGMVVLTEDAAVNNSILPEKDTVLALDGHILKTVGIAAVGGNVTIAGGELNLTGTGYSLRANSSDLTLEGVKVTSNAPLMLSKNLAMTFKDSEVEAAGYFVPSTGSTFKMENSSLVIKKEAFFAPNTSTVEINNSTVELHKSTADTDKYSQYQPLYIQGGTAFTAKGSVFNVNVESSIEDKNLKGIQIGTSNGATAVFDGCTINTNCNGLTSVYNSSLTVKNSEINTKGYCVSTNAKAQDTDTVVIENSKLNSEDTAVMFNINGKLTMNKVDVTAKNAPAVFLRAGVVELTDCNIVSALTGKYEVADKAWGSGTPEGVVAALLLGDRSSAAGYDFGLNLTMTNVTVKASGEYDTVYAYGQYKTAENGVTVNQTNCTYSDKDGNDVEIKIGGGNVTVNG